MSKNKVGTDTIDLSTKRGKLLTAFIIILLLSEIYNLVLGFFSGLYIKIFVNPSVILEKWLFPFIIVDQILSLIAYYGLWKLKKWAIYLMALLIIATFISDLYFMWGLNLFESPLLSTLIFSAITFYVVFRKWKYFT